MLAHDAVNYLTANDAPSPVQHFWSLSVEEQFYLLWPWIFVIAALLTWRRRAKARVAIVAALATAIVIASFVVSVHKTASDPAIAYFVTTTRIWELGAGGLLTLVPIGWSRRAASAGWLASLGAAAIVGAAFALDSGTPFPGIAAVWPVAAALLVLVCGSATGRFGTARLFSSRPFVFVGDISYSLYLWHWPIIVLWKSWSGGSIGILDGPAVVVVSVSLAWATKVFVEDPIRLSPRITARPWRSIATAVAVLVPVGLAGLYSVPAQYHWTRDKAHPGATVLAARPSGSVQPSSTATIEPPLVNTPRDQPDYGRCEANMTRTTSTLCEFGDTKRPKLVVAHVGDSVAGEWFDALRAIADRQHWELVTYLRQLCTWTNTTITKGDHKTAYDSCHQWGQSVMPAMLGVHPDIILTSSRPVMGTLGHIHPDQVSWREIAQGMLGPWRTLIGHGIRIIAVKETPEMGKNIPDCLSAHLATIERCSTPPEKAVLRDTPLEDAVRTIGSGAELLDMNQMICSPTSCSPVVGNVYVYRDDHHLTRTYVATMEPYFERRLLRTRAVREALAGPHR